MASWRPMRRARRQRSPIVCPRQVSCTPMCRRWGRRSIHAVVRNCLQREQCATALGADRSLRRPMRPTGAHGDRSPGPSPARDADARGAVTACKPSCWKTARRSSLRPASDGSRCTSTITTLPSWRKFDAAVEKMHACQPGRRNRSPSSGGWGSARHARPCDASVLSPKFADKSERRIRGSRRRSWSTRRVSARRS